MSDNDEGNRRQLYCRPMRVANIRYRDDKEFVEVVFLESARFYRLMKQDPGYDRMLSKLETALSTSGSITVCFQSIGADIILDVR
jgi:hypothetical protein